jgi:hypothetical protein
LFTSRFAEDIQYIKCQVCDDLSKTLHREIFSMRERATPSNPARPLVDASTRLTRTLPINAFHDASAGDRS